MLTSSYFALTLALFFASLVGQSNSFPDFLSYVPNGRLVKVGGTTVVGLGHGSITASSTSFGSANPFGKAIFNADNSLGGNAAAIWASVCSVDSDGDGRTNGVELCDPTCSNQGRNIACANGFTLTHPGFADAFATPAPTTKAPTTAAPTTKAPTTAPPTTPGAAPTTAAPTVTAAPTTKAPTTAPPTTGGDDDDDEDDDDDDDDYEDEDDDDDSPTPFPTPATTTANPTPFPTPFPSPTSPSTTPAPAPTIDSSPTSGSNNGGSSSNSKTSDVLGQKSGWVFAGIGAGLAVGVIGLSYFIYTKKS